MVGAEYHRHSRARVAETAKRRVETGNAVATPDVPECIDHRRRCTRYDYRTCCRGSRGSASLPCHALRKSRRNVPLYQGFFAEMQSIRPHSGFNPRLLCLRLSRDFCGLGRAYQDADNENDHASHDDLKGRRK